MGLFKKKQNSAESSNSAATNNKKTSKKSKSKIPTDVMESIPYRSVYPNGIIEDYNGRFSKSYRLMDTNFDTENEDKQESMVVAYEKVLNSIDEDMIGQLTIINRSISQDTVRNSILMKPKSDGHNDLRTEWNDIFFSQLSKGRNNLSKDKIFTISVPADNIVTADDILKRMDRTMSRNVRKITHQETEPLTIEDRLALLYDIYNYDNDFPFVKKIEPVSVNGKIDWKKLGAHGIMSKELVAPDSMSFLATGFRFGGDAESKSDVFCKTFFLDHMPTQLSTSLLNDISDLGCNMITSVTFIQMDADKASSLIKNQLMGMNAQINRQQSAAARDGVSNAGVVSTELENARDQANELMGDVIKRNQKIFKTTCMITILASSKQELAHLSATLKSIVSGHLCHLRAMNNQMERAFNTSLPLAQMQVEVDRILTTEASAVFMPFSVQDMNQLDGIYYGINPVSGNMIRYNRKKGANYNGITIGESGSGKSFIIKEELTQRFLNSDDYIIVIDPEGEYTKLGKRFGATIIDISLDGKNHINPLDMDIQYGGEGENPIPMKCDSIETLIESMVGGPEFISPAAKSIIHRVGRKIYTGYYNHMKDMIKNGITCDKAAMPTLQDFYTELLHQNDYHAQTLATAIESYCVGNLAIFAERTNVDTDNRMIIYNVHDMSSGMKELAMHVCMNDAWNHIIQNGQKGHTTALYVDEFHLFTKTKTSAAFMKNIYKRARKWHGVPLAITQSISDFMVNEEAEAIVKNCSFILMMNQNPMDRAILQNMYQISDQLLEYITDQPPGSGLIYNGSTIIPLENEIDSGTKLFELMDSRKKTTLEV